MNDTDLMAPAVQESRRRRLRWLVGGILLAVACGMASCVGCVVASYRAAGQGSDYAHESIQAIAAQWDPEELLSRADTSLLKTTPEARLRKLAAFAAKRLGPLKWCEPLKNTGWHTFAGTAGTVVLTAHYADCSFEKGKGRITLSVIRRDGTWRVRSIQLDSDLLLE